jgi:hypothetical protein
MFTERLPNRDASAPAHVARMIALMGVPSKELLSRGQFSEMFFDSTGMYSWNVAHDMDTDSSRQLHTGR